MDSDNNNSIWAVFNSQCCHSVCLRLGTEEEFAPETANDVTRIAPHENK